MLLKEALNRESLGKNSILNGLLCRIIAGRSMVLKPGDSTIVHLSVFLMHKGMDVSHNFVVHPKTNGPNNPDQQVVNVLSNWIR